VNRRHWLAGAAVLLPSLLAARWAGAAEDEDDHSRNGGKDQGGGEPFSLFVPTPERAVIRLLELARTGPNDLVLDLGSGDGRFPMLAARHFGARGWGVDINPELVAQSAAEARRLGLADRVRFEQNDVMEVDLRPATVVSMYLFPALINRLKPRLLEQLRPGTRIVIYDYTMTEWPPDELLTMYVPERYLGYGGDVSMRMWVVPANFSGRWTGSMAGGAAMPIEFSVEQRYQRIRGSARAEGRELDFYNAAVRGDAIEFLVEIDRVRYHLSGRLAGDDRVEGSVRIERGDEKREASWSARRVSGRGRIDIAP
jgi:SAM-dependent methyltransferase